ncbi:hypothetical protein DP42_4660 [Burkholderia pseudomallei]|nr:hypothetical protein DP42_2516 [Burkholderia pseudomallei]KGD12744.1 hypothetical protein DP42_2515 [Burkholderia pseudomallei]KGD19559.1 hypothetical protein DP42_4660 [Burkholderia pseudomallei]
MSEPGIVGGGKHVVREPQLANIVQALEGLTRHDLRLQASQFDRPVYGIRNSFTSSEVYSQGGPPKFYFFLLRTESANFPGPPPFVLMPSGEQLQSLQVIQSEIDVISQVRLSLT